MHVEKNHRSALVFILLAALGGGPLGLAQADTDSIQQYSAQQRDEAVNKAKAAMDAMDAKIDELESSIHKNWGKMDQAARRKARAALDDLKRQRRHMAESYSALKRSSAGAWEHMKKGFSDAYSDIHNAWEKAEQEFDGGK